MNSGQEIPGEFVVSRGDAPEVLQSAKAAFDDISAFVGAFVEAVDDDTVRFIGDYGLGAATNDFAAKVVAVIPFVGEERAHGWCERQHIGRRRDIGILAWSQVQNDRPAERIA
jgi:xanthine dehydrogenase iron-sulfur cluster and FAD-binding subunit A